MQSKHYFYNGNKLISWIQGRCIRCQRFISKDEQKYCKQCQPLRGVSSDKEVHIPARRYSMQSLRNNIDFDIPTPIRNILWGYY